jgi:hypothetical protein
LMPQSEKSLLTPFCQGRFFLQAQKILWTSHINLLIVKTNI